MSPRATMPLSTARISAPEHAYTDVDVRSDPTLRSWAEVYCVHYQGSFAPMREAQAELLNAGALSTRTARIVLNCARNDWRVADRLPIPTYDHPEYPTTRVVEHAQPAQERPALTLVPPLPDLPPRPEERVLHRHLLDVKMPLRIKAPFVAGRAGQFIHFTVPESPKNQAIWRLEGMGKAKQRYASDRTRLLEDPSPKRFLLSISVKTACLHPSILHEAELITDLEQALTTPRLVVSPKERIPPTLCPRCVAARS